jgi:O-antigen/teichoic acid export membrane protein
MLNIQSPEDERAGILTATIIGTTFALGIPLTLISKIRLALQQAHLNAVWDLLAQALIVIFVIICYVAKAPLPWFALAIAAPPLFSALLHWASFRKSVAGAPLLRFAAPNAAIMRFLFKDGMLFLVLQLGGAVLVSIDAFLAARWHSPTGSTEIALVQRLYSIPPLVVGLVLTPLWSAYADAASKGDTAFIRRTLLISLGTAALFAVATLAACLSSGNLPFRIWLGKHGAIPSDPLLLVSAIWCALSIACGPVAVMLNGLGKMRFQVGTTLCLLALAIPLKWVLFRSLGIPGLVWASVVGLILCVIVPWLWYVPKTLKALPPARTP